MAQCAVRFDISSRQYVPLMTRSGVGTGRKVMPPPSLRPGDVLTPKKIGTYRGYYNAQAANYQELLATELEQEVFTHFAPATIADIAYNAYAGHESGISTRLIGSEEDEQNHMAFIKINPTYKEAMEMVQQLGLKGNVAINTAATHELLCEQMDRAADYFAQRPELMADLAHLCAYQAFAFLDRTIGRAGFKEMLGTRFSHHGVQGEAFIKEIIKQGGTIADLGMGTSALFYMYYLQKSPVVYMTDVSQFNVSLSQRFAELIGRSETYRAIIDDLTAPCSRSALPAHGISHAFLRGVMHHIDDASFPNVCDYLFHILRPRGTFRVIDGFKTEGNIQGLLDLLRQRGFSATIDPATVKTENEEHRIMFEIEGQKQI